MKQLGNNLIQRIYYVNSGVIYNIGPIVSNPDAHAVVITDEEDNKIEKLFVDSQKLYFDALIEDGDKYTSGSFTKTVHELEPTVSSTTYYNYYLFLCEQ